MNLKKKWISFITVVSAPALICVLMFLGGCATDRKPAGAVAYEYEPAEATRQHPSSYFIDGFNVPKDRPARPPTNQPFFFKHCDDGPGRSPHSATSYDCNYSL